MQLSSGHAEGPWQGLDLRWGAAISRLPEAEALAKVAPTTSLEFLLTGDGEQFGLPFLGARHRLLEVDRLLVATSLAELISGWEEEGRRPAHDPAA